MDNEALVKLGAKARLAELEVERGQLLALLGKPATVKTAAAPAPKSRRRAFSAKERASISARMKKYWAARRKAKKG